MIPDWLDSRLVVEFLSHGQDLFLWLPVNVNPLEKYSCRSGVGSAITKFPASESIQGLVVEVSSRKRKFWSREKAVKYLKIAKTSPGMNILFRQRF